MVTKSTLLCSAFSRKRVLDSFLVEMYKHVSVLECIDECSLLPTTGRESTGMYLACRFFLFIVEQEEIHGDPPFSPARTQASILIFLQCFFLARSDMDSKEQCWSFVRVCVCVLFANWTLKYK